MQSPKPKLYHPMLCALVVAGLSLCAPAASYAESKEASALRGALIVSSSIGECTVMAEMIEFQETAKVPNGDVFVAKFWKSRLAQTGETSSQYIARCEEFIQMHGKFLKAIESQMVTLSVGSPSR